MEAYSLDLRKRVVAAVQRGDLTRSEIAEMFEVSTSWVRRLLQRLRETGSLAPLPCCSGRKPKLDDRQRERLAQLVREDPDALLVELRERLGTSASITTICRELHKMGLKRKKNH